MSWSRRAQIGLMASLLLIGTLVGSSIAQSRDPRLADFTMPGSVIIFPKFITGSFTVDGVPNQPRTEISIGAVCPPFQSCGQHDKVKIKLHWVCGTDENPLSSFICRETDFEAEFTLGGKIIFNTEGTTAPGNFIANGPLCPRGYLIAWVVNSTGAPEDQPIKYDALTGTAVLRETPTSVMAYKGVTIQAHPAWPHNTPLLRGGTAGDPALVFDGGIGHYQAITGVLIADIEFDKTTAPSHSTFLTLMTLDTRSNRPNHPTFVDFDVWNSAEVPFSHSTDFVCWQEIELMGISPFLTSGNIGSRKGVFRSKAAQKVAITNANDTPGPVTLIGLLEVQEGVGPASAPCLAGTGPFTGLPCIPIPSTSGNDRTFMYEMYNDGFVVPTSFYSTDMPNP